MAQFLLDSDRGIDQPCEWTGTRAPSPRGLGRRLHKGPQKVYEECRGVHQEEFRKEACRLTGLFMCSLWNCKALFRQTLWWNVSFIACGIWYSFFFFLSLLRMIKDMNLAITVHNYIWFCCFFHVLQKGAYIIEHALDSGALSMCLPT